LNKVFTIAASIPTINLISTYFSSFFGLLDDLSYYSYHQRNYSRVVFVFFEQLTNFTLHRWIPPFITEAYKKAKITYAHKIPFNDLNKTPVKFEKKDKNIYFLTST
jgi:hypothetical protein